MFIAAFAFGSFARDVGESDLTSNPERVRECFSSEAWERLTELKRRHDPDDVFFSYLTEPA